MVLKLENGREVQKTDDGKWLFVDTGEEATKEVEEMIAKEKAKYEEENKKRQEAEEAKKKKTDEFENDMKALSEKHNVSIVAGVNFADLGLHGVVHYNCDEPVKELGLAYLVQKSYNQL